MSSKKAHSCCGLRPIKLSSRTGARDQFPSLSLSAGKTLPQCNVLVNKREYDLFI